MAKHRKPQPLDPDDVLEGRARPGAREILALIHEINPTGRELPKKEEARRYAVKSRLQSLLIHRFPEEIIVEPTDEPGVVGLRHRASGADACHAVLASLDDDARSWAQMALDLGGEEAESARSLTPIESEGPGSLPPDAPLSELSTASILRRGRAALSEYDFTAARDCFAAAMERGDREAGALLLGVLVENLGLDEEALALEERLDREALDAREGRLLLALAAARVYQRERAVRLVRADGGDAAAEVFVALARGALDRDELDCAAADVGEIQRRSPSHPALLGLSDAVKKRRADARAPLEAEAQRLFDEARVEEAEARAEAVLSRWPESTVAQAIMRAGQERRRRQEASALAREGHVALEAGEWARAIGPLRRAIAVGLGKDEEARAREELARAEARGREHAEAEKAAAVVHLLASGHVLRGLTEYVALDDVRRAEVRKRHPRDELVYLEQTWVRGAGPDAKLAAQAVLALSKAITTAPSDPVSAANLVATHWNILHSVPNAKKIYELAQESAALRAKLEASQRYTAAITAFKGTPEGLGRALDLLGTVRREDLDEEDRADFDRFAGYLRRMQERMRRAITVGKLRTAGDFLGARRELDELIKLEQAHDDTVGPFKSEPMKLAPFRWREMRDDVVRTMNRVLDLRVYAGPAGGLLGMEAPGYLDVPQCVRPGAGEIFLVEAHHGMLFLQRVDVVTGGVPRRATMRYKTHFAVDRLQQRAGRAAVMGTKGVCVAIDPDSWDIDRSIEIGSEDGDGEQCVLAPGGRFVWTTCPHDGWWASLSAFDMERDAWVKQTSERVLRIGIRPLTGLPEPRVIVVRESGTVSVYEARGAPLGATQERLPLLPRSVVVHPSGKGLFALVREGEPEAPRVRWAELALDAAPLPVPAGEDRAIPDVDPDALCEAALDLDARAVFVLVTSLGSRARRLVAFALREGRVARAYDVEVPPRVTLASDEGARVVMAISPHDGGLEIVRLGISPPSFPVTAAAALPAPIGLHDVNLAPLRPCAPRSVRLWSVAMSDVATGAGIEYLAQVKDDVRREMIEHTLDERSSIVPRHAALWVVPKPAFAEAFAAAVAARYPGDPEMLQIPAQRAAIAGDWGRVRDLLSPIDPAALDDRAAQHHDHLLGSALLMLGEADEARRVLARGAAREGGWCSMEAPLSLVGLAEGPVRALDRAIRAADERLAAGDPAGARAALCCVVAREAGEVQSLARLCRAWLSEPDEREPAGAALDGFQRRLALTRFLDAHAELAPTRRRELPLPGARWTVAELDQLAKEAQAWLDADHDRPRPVEGGIEPPFNAGLARKDGDASSAAAEPGK